MLTLKNVLQVALAVYIKILKEHQKEKNQSTHSDKPPPHPLHRPMETTAEKQWAAFPSSRKLWLL